jgi:hypothetical protein
MVAVGVILSPVLLLLAKAARRGPDHVPARALT